VLLIVNLLKLTIYVLSIPTGKCGTKQIKVCSEKKIGIAPEHNIESTIISKNDTVPL
jgi:hypothetical protein